ncbi:MAG TPA: chemotaxis protein CheW [Gemmatimonadales bacterium]
MTGYLVVRSGATRFGLPLAHVVEVVPTEGLTAAPGTSPAVRGVMPVRGRLIPLAHLDALVRGRTPDATIGHAAVVMSVDGDPVAFEVDEAEELQRAAPGPLPSGWEFPWAVGVARVGDTLIPILDVASLVERLRSIQIREAS